MEFAFKGLIEKSIIIYMDDLTVFSKNKSQHAEDLKRTFERRRSFGISLNLKKNIFGASRGKLLGHIISKHGISIDPERIATIQKIPYPSNLKELRSFLGRINIFSKFISGFAEIARPINDMLKKGSSIVWNAETKKAFQEIKEAITNALVLISPNYSKTFFLYSFASDHSIVGVVASQWQTHQTLLPVDSN